MAFKDEYPDNQTIEHMKAIVDVANAETFRKLFQNNKKILDNALSFIEMQSHSLKASRANAIMECIGEVRKHKNSSFPDTHASYDSLISSFEEKIKSGS